MKNLLAGRIMAQGRVIMTDWVVEALKQLDGSKGTIARRVWDRHEPDIRASGDLLYEWQYELDGQEIFYDAMV